jgi:hypothetical protein
VLFSVNKKSWWHSLIFHMVVFDNDRIFYFGALYFYLIYYLTKLNNIELISSNKKIKIIILLCLFKRKYTFYLYWFNSLKEKLSMLDLDQIDLKLLELLQQSAKLTTKKLHSRLIYHQPCMKERMERKASSKYVAWWKPKKLIED